MHSRIEIAKQFDFCYGHRVWTQELNTEYSLDGQCACRHLHGHQGKIIVTLTRPSGGVIDGMVTDFKHLNWFKKFLDDTFDHKFVIDANDPLLGFFLDNDRFSYDGEFLVESPEGFFNIDPVAYKHCPDYEKEMYEGFVVVDFVPTSENFCAWLLSVVERKMSPLGVNVSKINFFETPKSQSTITVKE